jgi:hypothetical protein
MPELPLASLGLAPGDLLTVGVNPAAPSARASAPAPAPAPTPAQAPAAQATARTGTLGAIAREQPALAARGGAPAAFEQPDYVRTDAGVLVHRVCTSRSSAERGSTHCTAGRARR